MRKIAKIKKNKPNVCADHGLKLMPCIYPTPMGDLVLPSPLPPSLVYMCPICFKKYQEESRRQFNGNL